MYKIVLLALVVACVYADDHASDCCSMGDKEHTLHAWESLWSSKFGSRRVTIGLAIFKEVFEKAPEAEALFKHLHVDEVNSPEFKAHVVRVLNGLDIAISLEFNSDALMEQLHHLGAMHNKIEGMKASYFDLFREASTHVLSQAIPCFDKGAWERCMRWRQGVMGSHLAH